MMIKSKPNQALLEELEQLTQSGLLGVDVLQRESELLAALGEQSAEVAEVAQLGADLFATGALLPPTAPVSLATEPRAEALRLVPGQLLLGRYRILALVGVGGMGQVYLVEDLRRRRHIAIKVLLPTPGAEPQAMERRLRQELSINEKLTHPKILRTYDLEHEPEGGYFFFTMEYVAGLSLESLLARSRHKTPPLELELSIKILEQVSQALDFAHSRGIIHRDLKPANVLVSDEGEIKILDFGIAIEAGDATPQQAVGTAYYMAPEQLRGEEITPRADIYALGIMAFQLLTGHLPQPGMPGPSALNPAIPGAVDGMISKAIHWLPQERFSRASAFAMELAGKALKVTSSSLPSQKPQEPEVEEVAAVIPLPTPPRVQTPSRPTDASFARLMARIDHKRPSWLADAVPRNPPSSEEIGEDLACPEPWLQRPPPPGIRRRALLSRGGEPLLEFVYVPPGAFWMGWDVQQEGLPHTETPRRSVELEGYWIARTPVTNRAWAIFLDESGYQPSSRERGYYLRHWRAGAPPTGKDEHPVVWVTYPVAWAFCDFYGLSLPSEAQWEKAARSIDERRYPWGHQEPSKELCNFGNLHGGVCPVGLFPQGDSPYGLHDCAGNVFEWCANGWDARILGALSEEGASADPVTPPKDANQRAALRGGHYNIDGKRLRVTSRQGAPLNQSAAHTSFRPVLDWRK